MRISTKSRYALRMLLDLAKRNEQDFIPLKEIAERQGISKKYLEQIVSVLIKAEILQANRGFQGGYRLARPPESCTVGEVLRLTEGKIAPVSCLKCEPPACERRDECLTLPVWQGLARVVSDYFDHITLRDILDGKI